MRNQAPKYFRALQDKIATRLSAINEQTFRADTWTREGGGGGESRIFEGGTLLEKGGVNFSEVYGEFSPEFAKSMPFGSGLTFYATGVSLVLHPKNPFAPTVHANYRYLERGNAAWFGGGADLTPCYFYKEDAVHFHKTHSEALKGFGDNLYSKFKKNCDEYFYLPHRKETRGVGGIFFDYQLAKSEIPSEIMPYDVFAMVQSCGNSFLEAYVPIAERRMSQPFDESHKRFQEIRRGRYVEFNLLFDRGTTFGLKTGGRVESILMSLPLHAQWVYDFKPEPGTHESQIYDYLKPTDWLA